MTVVEGVAIHSGGRSRVTLYRDAGPIRFVRRGVRIDATVDNVVGTDHATSLGAEGERVHLVEHLLAALRLAGFWHGVTVVAEADELPILDGSAAPWREAVAGLGAPPPAPPPIVPDALVVIERGTATARVDPGETTLCCTIDFPHPAIGRQRWCGPPERFGELEDARTFGFLRDAVSLWQRGLALGATSAHAIVFGDDGPLSPLRHPDEPVRHKALDAIGDLVLLGAPIAAHVAIERGSHALHLELMQALAKDPAASRGASE
ncbi:MAG: UDP-3-O-acyl-N-acetylglucosamine deacetylase [Trueperaceae bacterium]